MLKKLIIQFRSKPELIVLLMMIMVIVMLIIPLPTYLVDFLIAVNLTMALLIFLGSFYISGVLEFSTFPSILLISTLFRLAISISTSRLVLTNADAGEIISSFGEFVISDNLIVGFVIFMIVTIVQFIVITKGSERIAEVAARFALDAMPGKQMSIDADLKAGVIDENELKRRRADLEAETQLYGALDGAMKFIKGDAIAGIVIIFVNFIGGISVGMVQHGMSYSNALSVYSLLTVGDALVAQIPALLISISGGFIVTRVNNNKAKNLGSKIIEDIFTNKFTMIVTAILCLGLGLLPGFPLPVFVLIASVLSGMFLKYKLDEKKNKNNKASKVQRDSNTESVVIDGKFIPEMIPIIITICEGHKTYCEQQDFSSLLKRNFFIEYGVRLPEVVIDYQSDMDPDLVSVSMNEIKISSYTIVPGMSKILERGDELQLLDSSVREIIFENTTSYWIPDASCKMAWSLGYQTRTSIDEFYSCTSTLLAHNITEFFGIQETKSLLDDLEKKYPDLLKECYRNSTVQRITEVFQRLLQEKISIRNMRLILESLVQWSSKEKDPIMLVEHVRNSLARYISDKFAIENKIKTIVFSSDFESLFRNNIRQTSAGSFINIPPPETEGFIQSLENFTINNGVDTRDVVLMVSLDIRRFVKKVIEGSFPDMEVLSFGEVSSNVHIDVVGSL